MATRSPEARSCSESNSCPTASPTLTAETRGAAIHPDFSQSFLVNWQSAVVATNPHLSDPVGFGAGGVELFSFERS
jgi:hypothetical protein